MGEFGTKDLDTVEEVMRQGFRSLGESDDYMPTLILRIVLVLKIESLLYVYFFVLLRTYSLWESLG